MNAHAKVKIGHSVCPHDCPSTCALDVELLGDNRIGRVHGAKDNAYTDGVICAKVARYAERIHHPDRLMHPLRRKGPKGSGQFERISWDDALDITAEAMLAAERRYGPEAVWPYYYAGTMGLVMRDGINRLRHAKRYSVMYATICTTTAWTGYIAGTGKLAGPDPREMAKSDMVVIWGTNPVNTQVNVMTHAARARKERGAKIVAVDIYQNGTMQQADLALCLRPGTDGALACGVMHVLFRDGHANWPYMEQYTDCPRELEAHLRDKTPEWASAITGPDGCRDRDLRQDGRHHAQDLLPAGLRLLAPAQRRPQHARGAVHPVGDGRVAARGRRRLPQQRRHLPLEQVVDRRPGRGRSDGARARSVPHRPDPDGRPGRPQGRPSGRLRSSSRT